MSLPIHLFLYAAFLLILGLHLYYDNRVRRVLVRGRPKAAHHCIRCETLYSAERDDQLHPCPKCGYSNPRLKY